MLPENRIYKGYVEALSPSSPKLKDFIWAFCVGGFICSIGEILFIIYEYIGISEKITKMLVPATLVLVAAVLTGIGIFDKIAKRAGA